MNQFDNNGSLLFFVYLTFKEFLITTGRIIFNLLVNFKHLHTNTERHTFILKFLEQDNGMTFLILETMPSFNVIWRIHFLLMRFNEP